MLQIKWILIKLAEALQLFAAISELPRILHLFWMDFLCKMRLFASTKLYICLRKFIIWLIISGSTQTFVLMEQFFDGNLMHKGKWFYLSSGLGIIRHFAINVKSLILQNILISILSRRSESKSIVHTFKWIFRECNPPLFVTPPLRPFETVVWFTCGQLCIKHVLSFQAWVSTDL